MDEELRRRARAARSEIEAQVDVDAELAGRPAGPTTSGIASFTPLPPRGRVVAVTGSIAAVAVAIVGGVVLLRGPDSIETSEPSAPIAAVDTTTTTFAPSTDPEVTSPVPTTTIAGTAAEPTTPVVPSTTTTTPATSTTTTIPPSGEAVVPTGTFDLQSTDLIARHADGDIYLYPDALEDDRSEPILLIDRPDPRIVPDEGEGANLIDRVAGTYDGTLVYSDCCEPVSGNLYAITEPGAEIDIWGSRPGESGRARLWGVGYGPTLEPGGSRVLAANWDFVNVVDLATGTQTTARPFPEVDGTDVPFHAVAATWTSSDTVAVLGLRGDGRAILSERSASDLTIERRRLVIDSAPTSEPLGLDFLAIDPNLITIVIHSANGFEVIDVDSTKFEVTDAPRDLPAPAEATVVRHSMEQDAWAWIIDDVAYLQRGDDEPVLWQQGVADIWFPTIAPPSPAHGVDTTTCRVDTVEVGDINVQAFIADVIADRRAGELVRASACLDAIPAEFTGSVPSCWSSCGGWEQELTNDPINVFAVETPDACCIRRSFSLFVSYRRADQFVDTTEMWALELTDDGLDVRSVEFGEPVYTREEAVDTLTTYLGHVRDEAWTDAALMLNDFAINSDERSDLARLDLDDYDIDSIATALEAWCAHGCVSDVPTASDLSWDGLYGIGSEPQRIRVAWSEGTRSIFGLPIQSTQGK